MIKDEDVVGDFYAPHGSDSETLYGFVPNGILVRYDRFVGDWIEVDYSELTANQFRELIEELGEQIVRNRKEQNEREANQAKVSLRGVWKNGFFLGVTTIGEDVEYVGDTTFEEIANMSELLVANNEVLVSFVHDEYTASRADKELG